MDEVEEDILHKKDWKWKILENLNKVFRKFQKNNEETLNKLWIKFEPISSKIF